MYYQFNSYVVYMVYVRLDLTNNLTAKGAAYLIIVIHIWLLYLSQSKQNAHANCICLYVRSSDEYCLIWLALRHWDFDLWEIHNSRGYVTPVKIKRIYMTSVKSRSLVQICYIQDVGKRKAGQRLLYSLHGWCEYGVEHDCLLGACWR